MKLRSLYLKIFLSFWLAMLLVGATLMVLALTTDTERAELGSQEKRLRQLGGDLIAIYENRGVEALATQAADMERTQNLRAFLFKEEEGFLFGGHLPPGIFRMASRAAATGEVLHRRSPRGIWFALPLTDDYLMVAELPPPSRLERLLNPRQLGVRVFVTFFVASVICFLLARSLTAPIRKLRAATRRFAEGDFAVRVAPGLGRRRDEIAELGSDFDLMAERIEDLLKGQRRLLRDISHELRSPLARLTVALELARQGSGPDAAGPLDRIELEAERLNALIGQLLTLTVVESGAQILEKAPVDLGSLVREIADDAAFEASRQNRAVNLSWGGEAITVDGSSQMLRQAVENVVRNALRYTAEGTSVEIRLHERCDGDRADALVAVRDHGPGVPEEALAHLFEPFYRVAEARDRQTGGTGIGLAITDRAVRLHGGTVSAANAPGGGLLVEIVLPAASEGVPAGGSSGNATPVASSRH